VNLKLTIVVLSAIAIIGCAPKKKTNGTSPMPAKADVLNVPSSPAVTYTPPPAPQPVVYDTPQQRPQPVIQDAVADASDQKTVAAEPIAEPAAAQTPTAPHRHAVAAAKPAAKKSASGGTRYTIKKGESLWTIAQAHYGDGNKWKRIAAANPKLNPDRVQAGQTIVLP
jgi:5'-nucleotidase